MIHYLHCEVFDSMAWAWKKLKHIEMEFCEFFENSPTISSGGVVHWLTTKYRILTYDFSLETFTILQVPHHLLGQDYDRGRTIVEYKGMLGLMTTLRGRYFELWVRNNHKDQEWKKKMTLDLEEFKHIKEYSCLHYLLPGTSHDAYFIVAKGIDYMTFYNTKKGSSSMIRLKYFMNPMFFYPFCSDFESVDMKNK